MLKKHVFGSFNLNNSEKHSLSFEDIFLGTLDTYTKKMNPPSAVLGGGGGARYGLLAHSLQVINKRQARSKLIRNNFKFLNNLVS